MAKIIKSFFNTSERRKSRFEENKEDETPHSDLRRKLSISRSGRMKQANKKRQTLSLEVFGQDIQIADKPKSTELQDPVKIDTKIQHNTELSPEEEIDSAFEIIDKT